MQPLKKQEKPIVPDIGKLFKYHPIIPSLNSPSDWSAWLKLTVILGLRYLSHGYFNMHYWWGFLKYQASIPNRRSKWLQATFFPNHNRIPFPLMTPDWKSNLWVLWSRLSRINMFFYFHSSLPVCVKIRKAGRQLKQSSACSHLLQSIYSLFAISHRFWLHSHFPILSWICFTSFVAGSLGRCEAKWTNGFPLISIIFQLLLEAFKQLTDTFWVSNNFTTWLPGLCIWPLFAFQNKCLLVWWSITQKLPNAKPSEVNQRQCLHKK